MSVLGKIWKIKNTDASSSILSKLLKNRGLKTDLEIEHFFHPSASRDFHDPFLMKGMDAAVARIGRAIESSERIMIFGDYDVDGITACAILMRSLRKLGANVSYRLPHRIEDGYGLRKKFIEEFHRLNVKIVITVDNGISCFDEIEFAGKLGMDVIITDHHAIPEKIPNAYAILHPKLPGAHYPFAELTGAGVALKLAQALLTRRMAEPHEEIEKLLDLACIGTISDVGFLTGENRYIVKEGLKVLENTRWPGLSRLKQSAGLHGKINTHAIGFMLGPRINAAGRISHPAHALKLLLHDAEHTGFLAENLERLNRKRQKMMEGFMETAENLASRQCSDSIIIISHREFHGGVIGLIAAKLSEKYCRPVIVMEERENMFVGSCRSVPGFNILKALEEGKDLFTHFGGHSAAAGFDLPRGNFRALIEKLKNYARKFINSGECIPTLFAECEISHSDVSEKTVSMMRWFEPFGAGNEVPKFLCRNIKIHEYGTVGADKKHLKIRAELNGELIDAIGFRLGQFVPVLNGKKEIDAICEMEENVWRGNKKIQLKIEDFKFSKAMS